MSRRLGPFAVAVLVSLLAPASPSGATAPGEPHFGWPHHGPFDGVLNRNPPPRTGGNGVLPYAIIHGPHGPTQIPYVDSGAHRTIGQSTRRFARPTWQGARLAWCAGPGGACGPVVAQSFCTSNGYRRVVQAVMEPHVGAYASTRTIGQGLACAGPDCHGFLRIVCTRD